MSLRRKLLAMKADWEKWENRISIAVAVFFAGAVIANAGLNQILKFSVPVLGVLYPVAIVLMLLAVCHKWVKGRPGVYPAAVLCTTAASLLFAAADYLPGLKEVLAVLPLANVGLGWVLPAVIGLLLGLCFPQKTVKKG